MSEDVNIAPVSAQAFGRTVDDLANLLVDCVEAGASVGFMSDLTHEAAAAFWRTLVDDVAARRRVVFVAVEGNDRVVGTAQLVLATPPNQLHRADVAKMLVSPKARRRGIGGRLLAAVEAEASRRERSVLTLDTAAGGTGEFLYRARGWTAVGTVPRYALMPDGAWCDATFFHKQLEQAHKG